MSDQAADRDSVRASVLEQIRKLLDFNPSNATEGEVDNATRLIRRLMVKHNLTEFDLSQRSGTSSGRSNVGKNVGESVVWLTTGHVWEKLAFRYVAEHCFCLALLGPGCIYFVGLKENRVIAEELGVWLVRQMDRLGHQAALERDQRSGGGYSWSKYRESFLMGMVHRVKVRFQEMRSSENDAQTQALVVFRGNEVDAYVEAAYPGLPQAMRPVLNLEGNAWEEGFQEGKNVSLVAPSHHVGTKTLLESGG